MSTGLEAGELVAGYRIERLLGRGGMAAVYLAEDTRLKRKVALKVLSPELAADEVFRQRFVDESERLASVDHPNIIPVYEAGQDGDHLFIAMRLVDTTDLKQLIAAQGPLPPERAVALVTQVAGALDAAHAKGLVHRDVKPANVLVAAGSGGEHAYLSDFGLTKRTEETSGLTKTGYFMGTIDYVAPEQISGKGVDGRTDQYALACVLFQCLTGHPPYPRDDDAAVLFSHLSEPVPSVTESRPGLPVAIDAVVAKGMAKEKEDRYPDCMGLAAAARAALLGDGSASGQTSALEETKLAAPPKEPPPKEPTRERPAVPPPPAPPTAPVPEKRTRRPVVVVGAIVLVLALVAGGFALLSGGDGSGDANVTGAGGSHNGSGAGGQVSLVALNTSDGSQTRTLTDDFSDRRESLSIEDEQLWQTTEDNLIVRDPGTGEVLKRRAIDRRWIAIDAGFKHAWIALPVQGQTQIELLDPVTGQSDETDPVNGQPIDLRVGPGHSVWLLTRDGTLYKFSSEGTLSDTFDAAVPGATSAIPVGKDVWLQDGDSIVRFHPADGTSDPPIPLPTGGSLFGVDTNQAEGEQAWAFDPAKKTLRQIDPKTGELGDPVNVGVDQITDAAIMGALLWVSSDDLVTEVRFESPGAAPHRFQVPKGISAGSIAPAPDGSVVWIGNYNPAMG
jgi:tRNA A-37 threonylcarbamoyl transferase component Bud32